MGELRNRVRELRARDRLSQNDLAQLIGASRQTIALIERGDYAPSIVMCLKIAAVFRAQVESIFYLEGEGEHHEP
ncbi:putative transcriptional regulator [Paenibacillus sp. UNC496MF]|uniref:helix-turn-helix transcriptional regulator n=1 Tax=Paenibacillus sp. UNC496MF TaxID=1502753 RepID=UPI0008E7D96F|nr:helix-turn-helix transcriptional regulator [Paenibacillus sp. UNC496MF]SFJ36063.1 putative transcriptional regulator [Paenibacillus sp. UNC496MF]